MPRSRTSIDARAAQHAAIVSTVIRLAPGHGPPHQRHLSLLAAAAAPPVPPTWTDPAARAVIALFAARARRDNLTDGADLVRRYFEGVRLTRPAELADGTRSQLHASVGEYCNAVGWPQMGARFGAEALLFADTEALRYRALTVVALGQALNGEYESARVSLANAREVFAAQGWARADTAYVEFLADTLIASAHLQVDRLHAVSAAMTAAQPDDPYWAHSARSVEAMARMLRGDMDGGLAAIQTLLSEEGARHSHTMTRHFLVCMRSDMLVAQGRSAEALATLAPYENPDGHGICFSMQRSASLLHLGRERELLAETDACVATGADHCLRTLTPLLLRRALAHRRLGERDRATASTEAAMVLLLRTGTSGTPFVMLPHGETRDLIAAVMLERPEFRDAMPCVFDALAVVTAPDLPAPRFGLLAGLTPTERTLTHRLTTSLSIAGIAEERGVSVNTVKSQVRSVYAKLGVRGRYEAVEVLTRSANAQPACGRTADG